MIQRLQQSLAHESLTQAGQIKAKVSELCALFEVSRSGYYAHLRKAQGQRRQQDQQLAEQMEVVFEGSRAT